MEINLKDIQEWYANKTNKTVAEFDDFDMFVSKVTYDYVVEKYSRSNSNKNMKSLLDELPPEDYQLDN
jgi:hypothetical protein